MSSPDRGPRDLAAAAAVHAARVAVVRACGLLAASPLDESAATKMRAALERAGSPVARQAIRRRARPGESRPPLQGVRPMTADRAAAAGPQAPSALRRSCQLMAIALAPGGAA